MILSLIHISRSHPFEENHRNSVENRNNRQEPNANQNSNNNENSAVALPHNQASNDGEPRVYRINHILAEDQDEVPYPDRWNA